MFGLLNYIHPVEQKLPNNMDIKDVKFEEFSATDGFLDEETIEIVTGASEHKNITDDSSVIEVIDIQNSSKA